MLYTLLHDSVTLLVVFLKISVLKILTHLTYIILPFSLEKTLGSGNIVVGKIVLWSWANSHSLLLYHVFSLGEILFLMASVSQKGTQGTHSNCIFKFPVFSLFCPCPTANFPCANLCDL